jgi:hypothetical protein
MWLVASIVPLRKPNGGVRPIALTEAPVKLLEGILADALAPALAKVLQDDGT